MFKKYNQLSIKKILKEIKKNMKRKRINIFDNKKLNLIKIKILK